ncbi:MAG TPA: hypothetical protein VGD56_10530 [Gemmatirosa sp.]
MSAASPASPAAITPACRPHWVGQHAARGVPAARRTLEFRNGRWFTGRGFTAPGTRFIVRGVFRTARPTHVDTVLDLAGGYVVPPFAEGHNHHVEPDSMAAYVARYQRDGVFYVQDLMALPAMRARFASAVNTAASIDLVSPNQGWTGPGGHPLEVIAQLRAAGLLGDSAAAARVPDTAAVLVVRTAADVARRWPGFRAGHPDFVKVFLLHSEAYAARAADTARTPADRGLNPTLVPGIVRRAHAAGLCVSAHVNTAVDFRAALDGGVDAIAHLPGIGIRTAGEMPAYRLTEADARRAAHWHVAVTTTVSWVHDGSLDPALARRVVDELMRPNIARLRAAGVPLLVGSDQFRQTSAAEAQHLVADGLFTPAEALTAWAVVTPRAIFPGRRIGGLTDGDEGSLLVLAGDPLRDFTNTARIRLRVKQGIVLRIAEDP